MISIKPLTEENIKRWKITNKDEEYFLVCNLSGQIRNWMSQNKYAIKDVNTLLLNKLLYFIIQELHKDNSNIRISGGWFRYGPCLEEYRKGEEGTTDLTLIQPTQINKILKEVKNVCEEEVPLFFKFKEKDEHIKYFYHYLKHIYSVKSEYPQLKEYYISKNELAYAFRQFAFNKEKIASFKKSFIDFQKAILTENYANFVKISEKTQEIVFNYLTIMKKLSLSYTELSKTSEFWFVLRKIASDFDRDVLGEFSYKNYIATYKDIDPKKERERKKWFEKEAMKYEENINRYIISNIEWINTLIKEG